jgi:diaminohydroxyphosphoribosylaminopyrimidine deaminase/5-amino-6-(5-phosphoribosylamino)uracil reductase
MPAPRHRLHDAVFMAECLRLAVKGTGTTSPNPLVGAVLVKNGKIVARGFHKAFGRPHAEIECLRRYRGSSRGTTLYVNLEPCSHYGKTPPCVGEILRRGVRRVVIGMRDPNPLVSGKGVAALRRRGVEVTVGILASECKLINRKFIRHISTRRPYVTVKIASTLDGKIAPVRPSSRWITGVPSRTLVHRWRAEHDAVLVGAGTIRQDDPLLTVRHTAGRDPAVVIMDGQLSVNPGSRVIRSAAWRKVIVCTRASTARRRAQTVSRMRSRGAVILPISSSTSRLPLRAVLRELYRVDIGSVLVEGGAEVFSQFVHQRLYDELQIFLAPVFMGEGVGTLARATPHLATRRILHHRMEIHKVGDDALLSLYVD